MDTIIVLKSTMLLSKPPIFPVHTPSNQSLSLAKTISFHRSSARISQLGLLRRHRCCSFSSSSSSGARRLSVACGGGIREIDGTEFSDAVLSSDGPVLVEFVATWCGPCRLITPAMEWLAQEYKDRLTVVKIDHDANPKLIEKYKVYGLPTLIVFKNGKEVPESRREGAMTKVKLKEYVDALLESISVV